MIERDDDQLLEDKYRVFVGPDNPMITVSAFYRKVVNGRNPMGTTFELPEVQDFTFVLRPERDPAAKVALAAYAAAVADTKPGLAGDLYMMMSEWYGYEGEEAE